MIQIEQELTEVTEAKNGTAEMVLSAQQTSALDDSEVLGMKSY